MMSHGGADYLSRNELRIPNEFGIGRHNESFELESIHDAYGRDRYHGSPKTKKINSLFEGEGNIEVSITFFSFVALKV